MLRPVNFNKISSISGEIKTFDIPRKMWYNKTDKH